MIIGDEIIQEINRLQSELSALEAQRASLIASIPGDDNIPENIQIELYEVDSQIEYLLFVNTLGDLRSIANRFDLSNTVFICSEERYFPQYECYSFNSYNRCIIKNEEYFGISSAGII